MSEQVATPSEKKVELNRYRWFAARFWDGMRVRTWWKLLAKNRFAFSPSRFLTTAPTFFANPVNSFCHRWQELRWRRKVEQTEIDRPPLFILGHWRSGTTFLHELLTLDPQHAYPTTYDCFSPSHFLSTGPFMTRWCQFLMPARRPMDNMVAGWSRPQEDEFAMLNLGAPSVYETVAFPNHGPVGLESLDFEGFSDQQIDEWKRKFHWFLRRVSFRDQRRLVLKSPPHLGRIEVLLKMFPEAQFVHIVRDPYVVYASSIRLWTALIATQSVQVPRYDWLPEFVLSVFARLYDAFERQRDRIPAGNYCEVRYEQLVQRPVEEMREVYERLNLTGFDEMRPGMDEHLRELGEYKTNRYELDDAVREKVAERWAPYIERYGY